MNFNLSYIPCKCSHPTGHLSHILHLTNLGHGRVWTEVFSIIDKIYVLLEIEPARFKRLTYTLCPVSLITYVSTISTEKAIDKYLLFEKPIQSVESDGSINFLETAIDISDIRNDNQETCSIIDRLIEMTKQQARFDAVNNKKPFLAAFLRKNRNDLTDELHTLYWRIYELHCTE